MVITHSSRAIRTLTRCILFVTLIATGASGAVPPLQERIDKAHEGDVIRLPEGDIPGPLVIRKAVTLVGAGASRTRLASRAQVTLVVESSETQLRDLTVIGPIAAVVQDEGRLRASSVAFEGDGLALVAREGAQATLEHSTVTGHLLAAKPCDVVVLVQGGTLNATDVKVTGGCRRGIELNASVADFRRVANSGSLQTALQIVDSTARFSEVQANTQGSEQAAVFAARSFVNADHLSVEGGLQGILLRGGNITLSDAQVRRSGGAGIALVGTVVRVDRTTLVGPFRQAGLLATEHSHVTAEALTVENAGVAGLLAVRSTFSLRSSKVSGAHFDHDGDFGHGIVAERSTGTLQDVTVNDCSGAAVYVGQPQSSVHIEDSRFSGVLTGVASVQGANVTVSGIDATVNSVGVLASASGVVDIQKSRIHGPSGMVQCDEGVVTAGAGMLMETSAARRSCRAEDALLKGATAQTP